MPQINLQLERHNYNIVRNCADNINDSGMSSKQRYNKKCITLANFIKSFIDHSIINGTLQGYGQDIENSYKANKE